MSEQLKFFKGNTEATLAGITLIPGALYHCLDTGNTYLATSTTSKKLFSTNSNAVADILDLTATATELNYMDGVTSNVQSQLNNKANKSDIATTAYVGTATVNITYHKISNFGNWGTGAWYSKGFSMLISSRAGEMILLSLAANDSNTSAKAFRLINQYSKIQNIYYNTSDNSIYVKAAPWANNICVHILSNVNGDYVPTVTTVSELPSSATEINIVEFGLDSKGTTVGDTSVPLSLGGSATRPTYNGNDIALYSDANNKVKIVRW